jgi:Secretion system C-terminal sorting domain
MKNLYLLLISFLFLQNSTAQSVQWFAPGARWEYDYITFIERGKEILYNDGQEIIGGEVCSKISGKYILHNIVFNTNYEQIKPPFYVFSRNDSIFLWQMDHFELIYDFKKQIGDTESFHYFYPNAILENIGDTVLFGNINTRFQKWRLEPIDAPWEISYVFEGIGGSPFDQYFESGPVTEYNAILICYSDSVFVNPICLVSTEKIEYSSNIHLFPNPVTDFFTLDLPPEILPAKLIITDILGRKINSFSQTETLQRFDLQGDSMKSGLYFLEIKGKNGVTLSRKFVH